MSENKIYIKIIPYVKTDFAGYNFIASVYNEILAKKEDTILLDFAQSKHFDANLAAVLGPILDKLTDRGYHIWITNINLAAAGVRRTLTRNHFFTCI